MLVCAYVLVCALSSALCTYVGMLGLCVQIRLHAGLRICSQVGSVGIRQVGGRAGGWVGGQVGRQAGKQVRR